MFKSRLFKSRRILLGNCIFGIMYVAIFALINFAFLNFKAAMVISIIFATGVLEPVCWMLKVDSAIQKLKSKSKKILYNSIFMKTVKNMSDDELQENLALVKEWLEESQGNGFTDRQKEILSVMHNKDIEIIQAEIDKRTNCRMKGTN